MIFECLVNAYDTRPSLNGFASLSKHFDGSWGTKAPIERVHYFHKELETASSRRNARQTTFDRKREARNLSEDNHVTSFLDFNSNVKAHLAKSTIHKKHLETCHDMTTKSLHRQKLVWFAKKNFHFLMPHDYFGDPRWGWLIENSILIVWRINAAIMLQEWWLLAWRRREGQVLQSDGMSNLFFMNLATLS